MGMPSIKITQEMWERAAVEAQKRDSYIKHHFDVAHLSSQDRDIIGFLGEFACCEYLGRNWKDNIRENYLTVDTGDIRLKAGIIDVKTETLPAYNLGRILSGSMQDDDTYGRRLIHKDQAPLLPKYDLVIFGGFARQQLEHPQELVWHGFGYLEAETIYHTYQPTTDCPNGHSKYPFPALPVRTSTLKPLSDLI